MGSSGTMNEDKPIGREHVRFVEIGGDCNGTVRFCIGSSLDTLSPGFGSCDTDTVTIQTRGFFDGDKYVSVLTLGPETAKLFAKKLLSIAEHMMNEDRMAHARRELMQRDLRKQGIHGKPSDADEPGAVD